MINTNVNTTELVFNFIAAFHQQHGHAPSQREIAKGCWMSQTTVRYHLRKLHEEGRIIYRAGTMRGLGLADKKARK